MDYHLQNYLYYIHMSTVLWSRLGKHYFWR
jgi:hypothetical protein